MGEVYGFFVRRTRTTAEEQDAFLLEEIAFDKKLVVRRVTQIGGLFVQDDLCIAGECQNARLPPVIREVDPPYFQIVMGCHTHHCAQNYIAILALEGVSRRDFSMKVKEKMLLAGFVLLLMLMVTVIYNDLTRIQWIERLMPWR